MAEPGGNLQLDGARLWDSLMEMAKIGPGIAGGNNRQTLTDEDAEGGPSSSAGARRRASMGVDQMGTMFMRARARTRTRCRSMSAAISTPSRPAASMTACSACSAGSRSSAR
jgi:hypothetical protein